MVALVYAAFKVKTALQVREIRRYANTAILDIASNWNEQALLQRSSPELFAATKRQEIDDMFVKYKQLGRLTHLAEGMGILNVAYTTAGRRTVAVYMAEAAFEGGAVTIGLALIKHKGGWQITGFDIRPATPTGNGLFKPMQSLADSPCRPSVG